MPTIFLSQNLFTKKNDYLANDFIDVHSSVAISNLFGIKLNAYAGNDSIIGSATAIDGVATGINNEGTVDLEAGNDSLVGNAYAAGKTLHPSATGIKNFATIDTGGGNNQIVGNATVVNSAVNGFDGDSIGIDNQGLILCGSGNDSIAGSASTTTAVGVIDYLQDPHLVYATGISLGYFPGDQAKIFTGAGNDSISGAASARGSNYVQPIGIASYFGMIITGEGNDSIAGTATATGTTNGTAFAIFSVPSGISNVLGGLIDTGNGNDSVIGTATSHVPKGSDYLGLATGIDNQAPLITGTGSDTILGTATAIGSDLIGFRNEAYGLWNFDTINTGDGDDIIEGHAIAIGAAPYSFLSVGILNQGVIDLGAGDDVLKSTSTLNAVSQKITLDESDGDGVIKMGSGNDYFKGFGKMNVYGDNGIGNLGFDKLDLGSLTLADFRSPGNHIGKSGPGYNYVEFVYNGFAMVTKEFEQFVFADRTVTYSELA